MTHARAGVLMGLMAATVVAGCASAGATIDDATQPQQTVFTDPNVSTIRTDAPRSSLRTIPAPVAVVRTAVQQTFLDYSIPLSMSNPAAGQIGNTDFYRTGKFMGRPMVELVSCGSGITGPNAASYRIYMSMLATYKDDGKGGTLVGMNFTAAARDVAGGATADRLPCGSTGRVETLFLERVAALIPK
ncbi:hypothetical protein [Gemmatimonas sp.]|uniref:hypothetical protein n=1 Tax=Gemmatimonas sp. TaxID=1962908 RepID=UPI00333E280E